MPSWNIHIAHVQRLLHEQDARALGICDANAFLFGNLVPDVYVGYLVRPTSRTVPYRVTHFADPAFVPQPAYWEFWTRYARASADERGRTLSTSTPLSSARTASPGRPARTSCHAHGL